jgi:predicted ATPase/DNA-binding NarL/FixJ family response regulator
MSSDVAVNVVQWPSRRRGTAHALPAQLTTLIGRERDLEAVAARLRCTRLLTLTGAGGVGKTRVALEAAARVVAGFPDGVWWIALADLDDAAGVASSVVRTLGLRPLPSLGVDELDVAVAFLHDRRALLLIDNCEHLVEEVARVVTSLLEACPSLSVLATSRVPLTIQGETRWEVPPLSLPSEGGVAGLWDSAAARLFIDRAGRVERSWRLTAENAWAVAEICRRLEGVPLALELAAARVATLAPEAIARGLDIILSLLTERSCVAEARQRSLRASLDWSYRLLPEDARRVLRRLGVCSGGASPELAHEVCAGDGLAERRILPAMETLVEHSLLRVDRNGASARYRLLETVRQYALEQLEDTGESGLIRDRHRDALLALAVRARREVLTPRQPEAFAALDLDAANLAGALDRALETDPGKALRLCLALDFWFRARARFREADDAYARALAASDPPPLLRARALAAWAWIVGSSGDFGRANAMAAEAAAAAEASGDQGTVAATLLVLANHRFFTDPIAAVELLHRCRDLAVTEGDEYISARSDALLMGAAWFQQDEDACRAGFDELRPRLERLGDRETLAWFWFEQAAVRYPVGEHDEARGLFTRAIAVAAETGEVTADRAAHSYLALIDLAAGRAARAFDELLAIHARTVLHGGSFALPWIELLTAQAEAGCDRLQAAGARLGTLVELEAWGAAHALAWSTAELAEVLRLLGEDDEAARHGERALEHARRLRNTWLAAKAQLTLGRLAAQRGGTAEAAQLHDDALAAIQKHRYRLELPAALEALAELTARRERHIDAARIIGAAERARRDLEFVAWPAQRAAHAQLTARVSQALGPEAFERAASEGAALELDDAIAWLRRARGPRDRPERGWESLTPTEVEVVRHAAAGLTNPQIADRLFVTRATVKTHLSHVYAKLNVRNRAQLAVQAAGRLQSREQPEPSLRPHARY